MAGRDRVAALKRARDRQRKIEEQVTRVVRAYVVVDRAQAYRLRMIERADQRVSDATSRATQETAHLVGVCGSVEAAAEILGIGIRQVRHAVSTAGTDQP